VVMIYRLTPIDPGHESWCRSKVASQYVRLWAHDCTDARSRAAKATDNLYQEAQPLRRDRQIESPKSPWELPEVTSCAEDPGEPAPPPDDVLTQDGAKLPIWAKTP
jgi:hypothetical protein